MIKLFISVLRCFPTPSSPVSFLPPGVLHQKGLPTLHIASSTLSSRNPYTETCLVLPGNMLAT